MDIFNAIILGIVQGLTEFLPVSSSGHLEIGKYFFGIDAEASLNFSIAVHGATVLSTIIVFRKDIAELIKGTLKFKYNEETRFVLRILLSLVPVMIIGLFFQDRIESFFTADIRFVGMMLLLTSALLIVSSIVKPGIREINYFDAFLIGLAQAFAVLPGISRSGATIAAGMIIGNKRENLARFSFLMVLIPVIGANLLEFTGHHDTGAQAAGKEAIIAGFIAAFITGYLACRVMIRIVNRGKLYWFGIYCLVIGLLSILFF